VGPRTVPLRRHGTRPGSSDHQSLVASAAFSQPNQYSNNAVYYIMARSQAETIGKQHVKLKASRLQNKGGQQDVDMQLGLVSAKQQPRYLGTCH
jgi:hypothetical protein